ncbi:MAG: hypothetical protein VX768_00280 [Planctomycetota bacterium]|nr:hypothetical protein [Planctomycetota bacterium]
MSDRNPASALLLFVLVVFTLAPGCSPRRKSGASSSSVGVKRALQENSNYIKSAFDYTLSIERYEEDGFKQRMIENLNNWCREYTDPPQWTPDPMSAEIGDAYRQLKTVAGLANLEFHLSDADYLQQAIWAKAIVDRITRYPSKAAFPYLVDSACNGLSREDNIAIRNSDNQLLAALRSHYPNLSEEESRQLCDTCVVFDWLVRNIQLDEMALTYEKDVALQVAREFVDVPTGDPAADGVDGPGYTKSPGEVLLTGKGDVWEKSRTLILLLRQLKIDAVHLVAQDRNAPNREVPWTVGVLIGKQVFLFDLQMGLPIPSRDYRRIATYQDVLDDPVILTQLKYKLSESTDADSDYRVAPSQLEKVTVLLDASQQALSRRMQLLQPRLLGDYKAIISWPPTPTREKLEGMNFHAFRLATFPFDHARYRLAADAGVARGKAMPLKREYQAYRYMTFKIPIKQVVRKDQINSQAQSIQSGRQVESIQVNMYQLSEARHRYILGVFDPDRKNGLATLGARKLQEDISQGRNTKDAAQMFVKLCIDDDGVDEIMGDKDWLAITGLSADSNSGLSSDVLLDFKITIQRCIVLMRADSSIWLALTNFETGDFGNSRNWFNQILRYDKESKWSDLANYNKARVEEVLREFETAIEMYRKTRSGQKFGNIIRARLIQRWNLGDESATQPE